jgi:hypothetical protein
VSGAGGGELTRLGIKLRSKQIGIKSESEIYIRVLNRENIFKILG